MEFTKIGRDDVDVEEAETVLVQQEPMHAQHQPDLNQELHLVKTTVIKQNRKMAEAYTRIATEIENVRQHLPVSKLKTFLTSECGLNRSDIGMYLRFNEALGSHAKTVTTHGLPLTVAKSLVAAPASGAQGSARSY